MKVEELIAEKTELENKIKELSIQKTTTVSRIRENRRVQVRTPPNKEKEAFKAIKATCNQPE